MPASTDDAVINNSNAVTINGIAAAHSLIVDNSHVTVSGTLTLGATLTVDGGAYLLLNGAAISAQSIVSDGGTDGFLTGYGTVSGAVSGFVYIEASGGTLKIEGSIAADQSGFVIENGSTLELPSGNGANSPVYFEGNVATLKLDAPSELTWITGIALTDKIDLVGIAADSASYSDSTLTVNETNGQQLTYSVNGNVPGNAVSVSTDNNGGTLVYWTQPPTITGTLAHQTVADNATLDPFTGVTVTDPNPGQTETVTVTLSGAANGTLSDPNALTDGSTFKSGVYTVTGTAAAVTADIGP